MTKIADTSDKVILENAGRRKAVKTIIGGVTAIAAYNALPAKWGTPVIESVFLPAHAATSGLPVSATSQIAASVGPCSVGITKGNLSAMTTVHFLIEGFVTPPLSGLPVNITINTIGGADAGMGTYASTITGLVTDANGQFSQEYGMWAADTQRVEVTVSVEGADGSSSCAADVPAGS